MSGILAQLSSVATKVLDPLWEYVTLLLHGDGTNGAQNNTFIDSSTNNFTITRNGNTTQGTFSPYGDNWSNYFSGSGQYLTLASNAAFNFGSGDFTVEFWINTSQTTSNATLINREWGGTPFTGGWTIQLNGSSSSAMTIYWADFSTSATFMVASTTAYRDNAWHHVAWVRNGTSFVLYLDGVSVATATSSTAFGTNSNQLTIANDQTFGAGARAYAGNISNMRIVKGTAVYTAAFTPSDIPLTVITNTSLLTCQSNRFKDNSTNAFTITRSGSPTIQRFSPFNPYSQYRDKTIGGSGYFDGTGDYLNFTDTSNVMDLGGATASFEAWIYPTAATCVIVTKYGTTGNYSTSTGIEYTIALVSQQFLMYYNVAGVFGTLADPTTGRALNQWYHIVVASNATTLSLYVNGTRAVTATAGITKPTTRTTVRFGLDSSTTYLTGYLSDVRFIRGTGAYDASQTTITVPTAPLTAVTNTSLLLSYTNAGIYDNAMMNDLETVGDAQVSTTQVKFGNASMKFDGTGDWLTAIDTPNLQMGSGNFTIEGWIYLNAIGVAYGIISKGTASTGISVNVTSGNKLQFSYTASNLTGATSLAASTWYYFAVVRSGTATGNLKIYLNGSVDATSGGAVTDNFNQTSILYVGASRTGTTSLNGYIDDLRVTKGYARTITTPTTPFPNQ